MKFKKTLATALVGLILVFSTTANADSLKPYAGVNFGVKTIDNSDAFISNGSFGVLTIGANLGAEINKNFAIEGRLKTGLAGVEKDVCNTYGACDTWEPQQGLTFGFYAKPMLPINEKFGLYALLGFTKTKLEMEVKGYGTDTFYDGTATSIGFGADFHLASGNTISLEFLTHHDSKLKHAGLNETKIDLYDLNLSFNIPF